MSAAHPGDAPERCEGSCGAGAARARAAGHGSLVPLASLVRGEALRSGVDGRIRPDPARLAAGWERRFVIERARVTDLVRLYEELGLEVALDAVAPELLADECADCRLAARLDYVTLYTRRTRSSATPAAGEVG